MLRWIVSASLTRRGLVLFLALGLVAAGAWKSVTARVDVFPEFAPPFVDIQTVAPGLSAVEVETLVTAPIERALAGVAGVETVRSRSVPGLSSINLFFVSGTDLSRARQLVQERLPLAAARLPAASQAPVMLTPVSTLSRVRMIGLTSKTLSQVQLSTLARWVVTPRLLSTPGVANVSIWGERPHELDVLVDPARLAAHGVTLDEVRRAATDAVSRAGGAFIDTPSQRLTVTRRDDPHPLEALAAAPVGGARLGDATRVVESTPPPSGSGVVHGELGVLIVVDKQPDSNTLVVTRAVDEAMDSLAPALRGVEVDRQIFRPATFVEQAIRNLGKSMGLGVVLVILVLVAFLAEWRTALVSAAAIPLSLLAAVLVLTARGVTLDVMILAGLVIALGEVVDDAIVDVENIARRLRENRTLAEPRPALVVVVEASLEVRSAIVYASLIVALVFLPLFLLGGVAGAFFRPLAEAYVLSVIASLAVALTVTPALALVLLPQAKRLRHEGPLARAARRIYRPLLERVVAHPYAAAGALALLLAGSGLVASRMGETFFPAFEEPQLLIHWIGAPGTSLAVMEDSTVRLAKEVLEVPGVIGAGAHIGPAELGEEIVGTNFAELWILLDPDADHEAVVEKLDEITEGRPGMEHELLSYLNERIEEVITGTSAPVVVRIFGDDLAALRDRADAVAAAMQGIPGLASVRVEPQVMMPEVAVTLRGESAGGLGVTAGAVDRALATLLRGERVGQVLEGDRTYDVVVRAGDEWRSAPETIAELPLETPAGPLVALGELASVRLEPTPNAVGREGGSRKIDVYLYTSPGADLGAVAHAAQQRLARVELPRGFSTQLLGEYRERQQALGDLLRFGGLALLGIVLVVYADFRSARTTLLVLATLPFALVGGVLAARLAGDVLPLGALVGLVTVLGIAARNGIMLISHFRHLEAETQSPPTRELVIRGAEERLVPILMTAVATALGLLPLVLGGVRSGQEIEHPLAVVVLGGLATSTVLNLLAMPALYLRFARR